MLTTKPRPGQRRRVTAWLPVPNAAPAANSFCATGPGGGIDPTCSPPNKGKGKARADAIRDRARDVPVTKDRVRTDAVDRNDLDAVEEGMTPAEQKKMHSHLATIRESFLDDVDVHDDLSDRDVKEIASEVGWADSDVRDKAHAELPSDHQHREKFEEALDDWYENTSDYGETAVHGAADALERAGAPPEVVEKVRRLGLEARNVVDEAVTDHREKLADEYRDRLRDEYDDSHDRRQYLRDFYDDHEHEPRYAGARVEGKWGVDEDDRQAYLFSTSAGNEYDIWTAGQRFHGEPVLEVGFSDANGNHSISGAGNAHEVFTTVTTAVTALLTKDDLPVVSFTAAEPSRQRLYDRLVRSTAAAVPTYTAVAIPLPDGGKRYVLIRRDALGRFADVQALGVTPEVLVNRKEPPPPPELPPGWEVLEPQADPDWFSPEGWPDLPDDGAETGTQNRWFPVTNVGLFSRVGKLFGGGKSTGTGPNCGTGAGGFKAGNTCGKGGGAADGSGGHLPGAPAAAPVKPQGGWVNAPGFKAWFGASKVVDANGDPKETAEAKLKTNKDGTPKVVFHGNPRGEVTEFKKEWTLKRPESLHYGPGFYFTEDVEAARAYAHGATGTKHKGGSPAVGHYYLRAERPFDADRDTLDPSKLNETDRKGVRAAMVSKAFNDGGRGEAREVGERFDSGQVRLKYTELTSAAGVGGYGASKVGVQKLLQEMGHDAITTVGPDAEGGTKGGNRFWVVFEPTQIKSTRATKFDPTSPDTTNTSYFGSCSRDRKGRCLPHGAVDVGALVSKITRPMISATRETAADVAELLAPLGKAGKWLWETTKAFYFRLEKRYGRKWAIAIFGFAQTLSWGAMLVPPVFGGPPLYVPSSVAAAPGAAVAEVARRAKVNRLGDGTPAVTQNADPTQAEIRALAEQLVADLRGEWLRYLAENPTDSNWQFAPNLR